MRAAERLTRHVRGLAAELAADYGELELVRSCREVSPGEYEDVLTAFDSFNQLGGACAWVTDPDGRALLVRPAGGEPWVDPGCGLDPGESYEACARRAVREATGLEATITGPEQLRVFRLEDGTGRPPVPDVAVVFRGRAEGRPRPRSVAETRWFDSLPERLAYPELAERPCRDPSSA